MRTFIMIAALASAALSPAIAAARPESIASMKARYLRLDDECRGGSHAPTDAVCRQRDRLVATLAKQGVCWSYSDWRVTPNNNRWHPCSQARPRGWRPD